MVNFTIEAIEEYQLEPYLWLKQKRSCIESISFHAAMMMSIYIDAYIGKDFMLDWYGDTRRGLIVFMTTLKFLIKMTE